MKRSEEIRQLKAEIKEKDALIEEFLDKNLGYLDRIIDLEKTVEELKQIVLTFQGKKPPPKNSSNSNVPPLKIVSGKLGVVLVVQNQLKK